jgi:hypothetical protein
MMNVDGRKSIGCMIGLSSCPTPVDAQRKVDVISSAFKQLNMTNVVAGFMEE